MWPDGIVKFHPVADHLPGFEAIGHFRQVNGFIFEATPQTFNEDIVEIPSVPIDDIEVLNSRDRNLKVFEEIVENIKLIGLKKPITVSERHDEAAEVPYLLVCGEGRLNAFRVLGETHIPALVIDVSEEDALIMSLAENIARRGYRPLEILADIEALRKRGSSAKEIVRKTGLSTKYVNDIVFLIEQGEDRLIEGVQMGKMPLTTALEIARAKDSNANLGEMLQEAHENGQLNGRQILEAKRLIDSRERHGPRTRSASKIKPPTTSYSLVRTYQKEVERQRKMVLKADHKRQVNIAVDQQLKLCSKLYIIPAAILRNAVLKKPEAPQLFFSEMF